MLHVEARGRVAAPADHTYRLIADYNNGHPRIIPPKYLRNLTVEAGGYGEGTVIAFEMVVLGSVQKARGRVTEPEPGRKLVESYDEARIVTSFVVEPKGPSACDVTIATDMHTKGGVLGWLERAVMRPLLQKIYAAELELIDSVARSGT